MKLTPLFSALVVLAAVCCKPKCPDPVTITRTVTAGSYEATMVPTDASAPLFENTPTTAYPTYPEMFVGIWSHSGTYYKQRHVVQLDLTTIPQHAIIDSAFIVFDGTDNATSGNVSSGQYNNYGDNSMYVEKVTSSWDKTTMTWDNQPNTSTTDRVSIANLGDGNGGSGKVYITNFVQAWVNTPSTNHGMMLKAQDEATQSLRRVLFASNNHTETALRPYFKIYYRN